MSDAKIFRVSGELFVEFDKPFLDVDLDFRQLRTVVADRSMRWRPELDGYWVSWEKQHAEYLVSFDVNRNRSGHNVTYFDGTRYFFYGEGHWGTTFSLIENNKTVKLNLDDMRAERDRVFQRTVYFE